MTKTQQTQIQFKKGDIVFNRDTKQKGEFTYYNRDAKTARVAVITKQTENKRELEFIDMDVKSLTIYDPKFKPNRKAKRERKQLEIKIKYFDKEMPKLEEIAVGDLIDLRSREEFTYKQGDFFIIPLGVAMEIPVGWKADLMPRSSTFKKWGLIQTNGVGKIDRSYSGDEDEWGMPVYATRDGKIEKYDRVCQFELTPKQPKLQFNEVESMNNESRGGFGSTGTK